MTNSEYWKKRIASATWKTYNSMEEKNRELLEFYVDASKAVKEELYTLAEKYSRDGVLTLTEMHKQGRLTRLFRQYEKIVKDLGKKVQDAAEENMEKGFNEVYKSSGMDSTVEFAMPNKELMQKLLNEPWRGDGFSGRLWKNQKRLAVGLNDLLLKGLQQGKTPTEIAVSLHNLMGKSFNDCHRLVRTESMHYLNSATLQRYRDDGVEYVQVWAAEDERTCDTCGSYHEKIYPIEQCPVLPFHPNCRCTILPVTDEKKIAKYFKSSIVNNGKNGTINSGAVSGALNDKNDPLYVKRDAHANRYYESIRNSKKVDIVNVIAKNTGISKKSISKVFDHIFINEHELYGGKRRFDADYDMAESFRRLREGKHIQEHDIIMLRHERLEYELMKKEHMNYEEAHKLAEKKYNYQEALNKFKQENNL